MKTRLALLVDLDGPLADFDAHFWDRCRADGIGFDITEAHEQRHRYFTEHIPIPAQRRRARRMVDSAGWFEDLPVTPGAIEGMAELVEHFDVWLCTKPLEVNPTCRDAKAAWVRRHFGAWMERRLIIAPDKSMVVGDILLDDAPKPEWFDRAPWVPLIFTAPYNGEGTEWDDVAHWRWGDPLDQIVERTIDRAILR